MGTKELLEKCVSGERKAWDVFISRYRGLVVRSVRHKLKEYGNCRQKHDYMDIVQSIFMEIWEKNKLCGIRDPAMVENWLCIVSINMTANFCARKEWRQEVLTVSMNDTLSPDGGMEICETRAFASTGLLPDDILQAGECMDAVKEALETMSPKQRIAFKLRVMDGKKIGEIAEIMHVPRGTVGVMVQRGREALRKKIGKFL